MCFDLPDQIGLFPSISELLFIFSHCPEKYGIVGGGCRCDLAWVSEITFV